MNRYETHQAQTFTPTIPLRFDGCQIQLILEANGIRTDEFSAWRIGFAVARHIHRHTVVRYSDHCRARQDTPLNPELHRRLLATNRRERQWWEKKTTL